jgi:WD40 repeat protein
MTRTLLLTVVIGAASVVVMAQGGVNLVADRTFAAGVGRINDVAFSSDGRLLAVVGVNGGVAIWDTQTGTAIRQVPGRGEPTTRVAFGATGNSVAIGSERGGVSLIDLRSGQGREVAHHSKAVTSLALSPDAAVGASGDASGDLFVWPAMGSGSAEPLREDTKHDAIVFLAFTTPTTLVSITKDLRIVTWDVSKKRSLRRGTVQLESVGREAAFSSAGIDGTATQLVVASQYISAPRGGVLANGPASPGDLKRTNVLIPYGLESGIAADPVALGDYLAEHVGLSPGACYAVMSSNYRDQGRLHVWSLVRQGQDVARVDLPARPVAATIDPTGLYAAAALPNGDVRTFRLSGATAADCTRLRQSQQVAANGATPRIVTGSTATPLFTAGTGFKVAVLRFDTGGVDAYLGDGLSQMIAGQLANSPSVVVVERADVEAIVKEMQLQRSGLTAADAVRIGRGLNTQKVLLGSVTRFGDTTYVLQARVVDVETQQVQGSREVTCESCKEQDLPRAIDALRRLIVP